jgi:hypothetical protein
VPLHAAQHCPPGRFLVLLVGGLVLYVAAQTPLVNYLQRLAGVGRQDVAAGAPAPAPGGRGAAILRELRALVVGFFTSLLPGARACGASGCCFGVCLSVRLRSSGGLLLRVAPRGADGQAAELSSAAGSLLRDLHVCLVSWPRTVERSWMGKRGQQGVVGDGQWREIGGVAGAKLHWASKARHDVPGMFQSSWGALPHLGFRVLVAAAVAARAGCCSQRCRSRAASDGDWFFVLMATCAPRGGPAAACPGWNMNPEDAAALAAAAQAAAREQAEEVARAAAAAGEEQNREHQD